MTCKVTISNGRLVMEDMSQLIRGRHHSQMSVFGFQYDERTHSYIGPPDDTYLLLQKVTTYLLRNEIPTELSHDAEVSRDLVQRSHDELTEALDAGRLFKDGTFDASKSRAFLDFISNRIPRQLKVHQVKAALHLLAVRNGANFSVPGSGKTSVVLAVFEWLRHLGYIDSIFVVGPPSCFAPWRMEYEAVLGDTPRSVILAGGDIDSRQNQYYASKSDLFDLYLTSFQTLQRDWTLVTSLFRQRGVRFALVVDEAHYIKQPGGAWASAVLAIAKYAEIRWILTGTPFPLSYVDAFNYFDVLWPYFSPITRHDRVRITSAIKRNKEADAAHLLKIRVGPLFYRVRKADLGLAPQDFHPPTVIAMNEHERFVYDAIVKKLHHLSLGDDEYQDFDLLMRLRRGRMMRLRQCISYAGLLQTAIHDYNENLLDGNVSLGDRIKHYGELESPAKLKEALSLIEQLQNNNEKVVIWSNFVDTLKLLRNSLVLAGFRTELIFGATPTETTTESQELTREKIISQFVDRTSGLNVLVANPAACAESISLHKECSHAIYYDLSYNCAQYLQSLDRIHRVGGSETKVAHYHFLQYADTIDEDILSSLRRKAINMGAIVDQEYPIYSLDMFSEDDEITAYERLFR
jgi:SNF2 family DNA or RNA helicase